ncbi:MAG: antitoxin Xre/MbcA/ParS toxin-binding domain-containing protein [Mucilaginibacter sp.]|uniref:antitoxin Xre/MbcA/ParS toxin-binding domain-containing protein n=1 Tax=Mucilaginibacter sp. TaxID=1882438 RepID=UPI0031A2240D
MEHKRKPDSISGNHSKVDRSKKGREGVVVGAGTKLKNDQFSGWEEPAFVKSTARKHVSINSTLDNPYDVDIEYYQPLYANPISLLSNSKSGLQARAALDFIQLSGFTHFEFQSTFKTTVKTIQNYATQQLKLDSVLSEKLLKAFALFEKGIGVFGSPQAFHDWLNQPAFGLGNELPYTLMDTITGIMLIEEELIRLEYGDLA